MVSNDFKTPSFDEMSEAIELLLDLGSGDSGGSGFARDVIASWAGDPWRNGANDRETCRNMCVDLFEARRMSGNFINAMFIVTRGGVGGMSPRSMHVHDDPRFKAIIEYALSTKERSS